jgi:signal transduction histidine kinase/DNA-binding response OmpR family regulator
MNQAKNKFTLKIILSYLVIGSIAVVVSGFLYSEYKDYISRSTEDTLDKKFIETGTLINSIYETDGFSRIALLTNKEEDFDLYRVKMDSLFDQIQYLKTITPNEYQIEQLDCVRTLLFEKSQNIDQLRILKLTSNKDTSFDDILKEIRKLEATMGKNTLETMIKDPSKLSKNERRVWLKYADWFNRTDLSDTNKLKAQTVDSMLVASRYILAEAKKENSRIRESLEQKENELIKNDLTISAQLRYIISALNTEINSNSFLEKEHRLASIQRTSTVLKLAGIFGSLLMLLFSYIIITDFFRAEKFKKRLQKEKSYSEDLLKSREQLISTVSHDLKTPLNTILGYSELIENTSLSEKQKHYIKQISSSSNFVGKLVDDLLDYSKLEAGKLTVEQVPFSLENIINHTAKASQDLYSQKTVKLIVTIDEAIKGVLYVGDPLRLRQIINNLVGNAYKFTEEGSVTISVHEIKTEGKVSILEIRVEDTGIGISEKKQQLIFKEFMQAEVDTAQKFGGYGLGLAISKKLAHLLQGTLAVESVLGEGSTFKLTIPLEKSFHIPLKKLSRNTSHLSELKALVFDDDPAMLSLLKEVLEHLDIKTYAFTNFELAQKEDNLTFDFVLTDIQMPNTDGFEVLNRLKTGALKNYDSQAVIAMTGSREHSRGSYLEKGFDELLMKPFTKDQLLVALGSIFPDQISTPLSIEIPEIRNESTSHLYNLSLLESFLENKQALHKILGEYFTQSEEDRIRLNEAISNQNYDEIKAASHKMLTMKRQIQAKTIIPILENLEHATPDTLDKNALKKLSTELNDQYDILIEALKKEIA